MESSTEIISTLVKLDHQTSSMLSKTVHDLNNPLTVVIGQLSILDMILKKENVDLERVKTTVGKISTAAEKFQEYTSHFKHYYKILQEESQVFSIAQILNSTAYYFSALAYTRGLNIQVEINKHFSINNIEPNLLFLLLKLLVQEKIDEKSSSLTLFILTADYNQEEQNFIELGFGFDIDASSQKDLILALNKQLGLKTLFEKEKTIMIFNT